MIASFVIAIGYYDRMGERQAADQRREESDWYPLFKAGSSFHGNHDNLPVSVKIAPDGKNVNRSSQMRKSRTKGNYTIT